MIFAAFVLVAATVAGAVASVGGFGIGTLLTPLLAIPLGTKLGVAAVSIPHLAGTLLRFWQLRAHLDRAVFVRFGLVSAAGGLLGALAGTRLRAPVLTVVLAALLILAGVGGLAGLADRLRLGRRGAWIAGFLSGLFGGLVGNQGGIRSAALMGFDLRKESFVATATAVGLMVDAARMPIYLLTQGPALVGARLEIAAATAGVVLGTVAGTRVLRRIPDRLFRPSVSALLLLLGAYLLLRP